MPMIETKLNGTLTPEQETRLKERFGQAIALIPGKSERWLMLEFEDGRRMHFAGTDAPCAFVEVKLYRAAPREACAALTRELCGILAGELGLDPARIYVKYSPCDEWGWNGENF